MKYAWIYEHRDSFPIIARCDALRLSTSGDYDSLQRQPSPRTQRHQRIQRALQQVDAESYLKQAVATQMS